MPGSTRASGTASPAASRPALDHGFERFIGTMLPDNREAIGLLHLLSADASVRFIDGSYSAVAPLSRAS
jgi:hypothetical protein